MFSIQEYLLEFIDYLEDRGIPADEIFNLPLDEVKPYYDDFIEYKTSQ